MAGLPTGTVTFLFTDIEAPLRSSTRQRPQLRSRQHIATRLLG